MNKAELIDAISAAAQVPKVTAASALNAITNSISEALQQGDNVTLVGFGTFTVKARAAREGRNPRTGGKINIAAAKSPTFKAGKDLKNAVNLVPRG
ncbi:HU family DNA-binding protein [Pseudomonas sp. B14-6]|uniref:HU family DNA-binding protein n=1 Tax=Pseudomonas sp. B14-6 TaxID=2738843 RepID=UPI00155ED50F|nr:HU family DNA-binding protein [Pseudomonas sp. B14-6]QKG67074.1 HU family DNA-binding protein [Pseudomonas sp. B14-6]